MAMTKQHTGAQILLKALKQEKVEVVFGYPGGAVLHIYDELAKDPQGIKHILCRHEQGVAHAADGYARAAAKPGVCLVTSGPGLTNAVTGIASANMDSVPLVIISGQVPSHAIGEDAFQEVDSVGITRPCVKYNMLVKRAEDIAPAIKKAFYLATSGRPGPVLVDIPKDVSIATAPWNYPAKIELRSYQPSVKGHPMQVKRALQLLAAARRPYVYAGGGVINADAAAELRQLVELLGCPCTNTLMGLGALPASHKQFIGMLGMHGTYEANMAMQKCDLLLAVGARFDDRVIGNPAHFAQDQRRIVHIDVDPSSISKRVAVDVPIVGDVRHVLQQLLKELKGAAGRRHLPAKDAVAAWWKQVGKWQAKDCLRYRASAKVIKPQHVIERLHKVTRGRAYVTSDVGQHQMWAAQYYGFEAPRRWINSGGLGAMGFGLPAAIGAQLAQPKAQVACVTGEASIVMCIQELSTAKQYRTPVKVINLNNRYMGMVRQWQEFFHGSRYSESYMDALPDFVSLAESFGHVGMAISDPADVDGALKEAFALKDRLVFMDFKTDDAENVFPMVAAGKGLTEMVLAEDL